MAPARKREKKVRVSASQAWWRRILYGNVLRLEFFTKHWITFFALLVLMMVYISTKYQCMTAMEEIKKLEKELSIVKSERIRHRSTYMSRIRESAMQQLVDSVMPGLAIQERPPYHLRTDNPQN